MKKSIFVGILSCLMVSVFIFSCAAAEPNAQTIRKALDPSQIRDRSLVEQVEALNQNLPANGESADLFPSSFPGETQWFIQKDSMRTAYIFTGPYTEEWAKSGTEAFFKTARQAIIEPVTDGKNTRGYVISSISREGNFSSTPVLWGGAGSLYLTYLNQPELLEKLAADNGIQKIYDIKMINGFYGNKQPDLFYLNTEKGEYIDLFYEKDQGTFMSLADFFKQYGKKERQLYDTNSLAHLFYRISASGAAAYLLYAAMGAVVIGGAALVVRMLRKRRKTV